MGSNFELEKDCDAIRLVFDCSFRGTSDVLFTLQSRALLNLLKLAIPLQAEWPKPLGRPPGRLDKLFVRTVGKVPDIQRFTVLATTATGEPPCYLYCICYAEMKRTTHMHPPLK